MSDKEILICSNPGCRSGKYVDKDELPVGWFRTIWHYGRVETCSRECIPPALAFKLGPEE
jgi:hypothetical protein